MTISRTVRTAALIAVLSACICAVGAELFNLHWKRELAASGHADLLATSPAALERDLRSKLIPGTPRSNVETVLHDRHLRFQSTPGSHVIRAEARELMGSTPLAETELYLWIFFDGNGNLQRIQSRVTHSHSRAPFRVE